MRVTHSIELVHLLDAGAMGSVWVAQHDTLGTEVAVKFLLEEIADTTEALERFRREARASAKIKSPHVTQIFDAGVTDVGLPFIVMELLDGEPLSSLIDFRGYLDVKTTGKVLVQVAKALTYAHKLAIIHRDIKPDNIFMLAGEDTFAKVLDFGIAKQLDSSRPLTSRGIAVGTPHYMSREQILSLTEVDEQTDLWALAVVAYECLTGDMPFDGDSLGEICEAICKGQFTPITALMPELPPALDSWFERALHRDPNQRFDNARQLAATFVAAVDDALESAASGAWDRMADSAEWTVPASTRQSGPVSIAGGSGIDHDDAPNSVSNGRDSGAGFSEDRQTLPSTEAGSTEPAPMSSQHASLPFLGSPPVPTLAASEVDLLVPSTRFDNQPGSNSAVTAPINVHLATTQPVAGGGGSGRVVLIGGLAIALVAGAVGLLISSGSNDEPARTSNQASERTDEPLAAPPSSPSTTVTAASAPSGSTEATVGGSTATVPPRAIPRPAVVPPTQKQRPAGHGDKTPQRTEKDLGF